MEAVVILTGFVTLLIALIPVGIIVGIVLLIRYVWREDAKDERAEELRHIRETLVLAGIPRSQWRKYLTEEEWKLFTEG